MGLLKSIHIRLSLALLLVLIAFPFFRYSATKDSFILHIIPILLLLIGIILIFLPNSVYKK